MSTFTVANCSTATRYANSGALPSEIREKMIEISEALGNDETLRKLCCFLPTATIANFIDHLREVADIEDLL